MFDVQNLPHFRVQANEMARLCLWHLLAELRRRGAREREGGREDRERD